MKTNAKLIDLLETAHGYALAGSLFPVKSAMLACEVGSTDELAKVARELINRAGVELGIVGKPSKEKYAEGICMALERVETGVWP